MGAALQIREGIGDHGFKPRAVGFPAARLLVAQKFVKFCLVGGSGLVIDMIFLFLLADPRCLGLGVVLSKILSAESAMVNNFIWNELWTFRSPSASDKAECKSSVARTRRGLFQRFLTFNAICGIGIGLAVILLHLFHESLGWNLYLSNLLAIVLVTFWNFALNSWWNWRSSN
jgi:dolichol-phosphate mannosyltransferase